MSGPRWKVVWTISLAMCAVLRGSAQGGAASCDPRTLDADSYTLATRGVAEVVLEDERAGGTAYLLDGTPPRSTI